MRGVVFLVTPAGQIQDFHLTMLGRPTVIIFSDLDAATELAQLVAEAWRPAGYGAAALKLDTDTDQGAVDALKAQWPQHDNVYLADSDPAVIELMNQLRAGGRLTGPAG